MKTLWISSAPNAVWKTHAQPTKTRKTPSLQCTGRSLQSWQGFGGCFNELGWIALSTLKPALRKTIFTQLFSPNGCNFHYCRLPIGANDYSEIWYSHNEHDGDLAMSRFSIERDRRYILPYIRAARQYQPDLYLFASPWSPPTWLKHPKAYNFGRLMQKPEVLKAYARYFLRFVRDYAKEGVTINAVHVQNEPNSDQKFPSCLWTGDLMRNFIRDHLGPLFRKEKLSCEIWIGTIERGDFNAWANKILIDPKARQYVSGIGYQWAGKEAVQRTHMSWPDIPIIQTENECGDGQNTWEHAFHVFDLIHHYVTNGAQAYVYWNMVLKAGGESTWGWHQNSMITVDEKNSTFTWTPEFYVMKQFARFIQKGAIHLELKGMWAGNALAFRNPDNTTVFVIRNPFADAQPLALEKDGNVRSFTLPPKSINTIIL